MVTWREIRQGLDLTETDEKVIELEKKSLRGALAEYANPERISMEEGAWARAAVKKHRKQQE